MTTLVTPGADVRVVPSAPGAPVATVGHEATLPAGTPVAVPVDVPVEVRRTLRATRSRDVLPVIGAAACSLSLSGLICFALAPFTGVLGFVLIAFALFVAVYALLVSLEGTATLISDRVAAVVVHALGVTMLLALVVVVGFVVLRGRSVLPYGNFYARDMSVTGPLEALSSGGIWHGIVGTLIIITIALTATIPLGIVCAVFLSETRGPFTRTVRTVVEAMTALPSIIAGLFVYAIITLGVGQLSGFAAAMAVGIMMLPIIIRAADVVLRLVSGSLKEAAVALGAPRWRVVWHVVLPTARSGIMTAIILGTARGIGETSPVLLTSGFTATANYNPFSGPMVSLPLLAFMFTKAPEPSFVARGFGTATVLLLLVLVLFAAARVIGGRNVGELSRAQQRRRARASLDDLARFQRLAATQLPGDGTTARPGPAHGRDIPGSIPVTPDDTSPVSTTHRTTAEEQDR